MAVSHSTKSRVPIPLPPQEYLKECFAYDPGTGVLSWKERPRHHFTDMRSWKTWNAKFAHRVSGCRKNGYVGVIVNARAFQVHRVIWKWMTGEDPHKEIDHKNLIRSDNRWDNLRAATWQQNKFNKGAQRNNVLGLKGVCLDRNSGKFKAQIKKDGKNKNLGHFSTIEQAKAVYDNAAREIHGEFYCTET